MMGNDMASAGKLSGESKRVIARRTAQGLVLLVALTLLAAGCSSKRVSRREAGEMIDLSGRWNDTDSRLVAEEMIQDSMSFPWIDDFQKKSGKKPTVITYGVKNRTSEHINTQTFMKNMERAFLRSGRVTVVASPEDREKVRSERADQQSGFTGNPAAVGRELGANFVLTGVLNSINDRADGEEVVFYQTNLELINVETNEKVWIGEKKIKKLIDRAKSKL